MKWSEHFKVNSHDTDINGIVRPSVMLRYMQEAANLQLYHIGPSNEQLRLEGKAFLLSRLQMKFYNVLHSYDEIMARSWACESRLTSFNRCGDIYRGEELIAQLVTVWALVNIADKTLCRAADTVVNYDTDQQLVLDLPSRVRIPKEAELKLCGQRLIGYGDVDLNIHMNNTNYPDMLCSYAGDMIGRRALSCCINFSHEAAMGETIKIYSASFGDTYYFRTQRENGDAGVEAEIVFGCI